MRVNRGASAESLFCCVAPDRGFELRLQIGPHIFEQYFLGTSRRMYTIGLHQLRPGGHARHEEWHQHAAVSTCQIRVDRFELVDVGRTVIRWESHTRYNDLRARCPGPFDYLFQVTPDHRDRLRAEPVIAAEFDNDDVGLMRLEGAFDAGQPVGCGVTGYAGVYDLVRVAGLCEFVLQQIHPTLVYCKTIGGAQAVTEHQDYRWFFTDGAAKDNN